MKKIHKIISRTEKRVASFLLAMLFILTAIFSSMSFAGYKRAFAEAGDGENTTIEVEGEQLIIRDDALHFIFRHWHTNWDSEATLQSDGVARRGDQYDADTGRYFVMVEGYIIPHSASEMESRVEENKYTIVLVNQATGELVQASELYNDYVAERGPNGDKNWKKNEKNEIELIDPTTPYLGALNKTTGSIELKVKKLADVYTNANGEQIRNDTEKFCGISLSAGRGASTLKDTNNDGENDTIVIQYSKSTLTHIVKGHIFYSSWTKVVTGTNDDRIITAEDAEVDTAEVYTWNAGGNQPYPHEEGDVVGYKQEGDSYKAVSSKEAGSEVVKGGQENILEALDLSVGPKGVGDVQLTTFYSSYVGLHTNKTLVQSADGRYFLFDLEAWYIEGYAAQLGYVIDASGSMAGTSDIPAILNISVAIANRLGVLFNETTGEYSYTHYDPDIDETAYHTHYLKTNSMPYFEFRDSEGETHSIQASKILDENDNVIDRSKIENFAPNPDNLEDDEKAEYDGLSEVPYVPFEEKEYYVTVGEGDDVREITLEQYKQEHPDLVYRSTYYSPTYEEKRIDMQKFLITGDRYTPSTSKHAIKDEAGNITGYYCWAGLVKEFGKEELCETISTTIGGDYKFTTEMWDQITALKGKANQIGSTITKYYYPQRENLIAYYEISPNNGNSKQRTWYFNSIDTDVNGDGIRKYITPTSGIYSSDYYTSEHFARAVKQQGSTGAFDFSDNVAVLSSDDFAQLGWKLDAFGQAPVNFGSADGLNIAGNSATETAFMLLSDKSTPKDAFTLSFSIAQTTGWSGATEILYIGGMQGDDKETADFRLVRDADGTLTLYYGNDHQTLKSGFGSLTGLQRLTFTYDKNKDGGTVTFYLNGANPIQITGVALNVECMVFDPFKDSARLVNCYIDNIFVYDTALSSSEVSTFNSEAVKSETDRRARIDSGTSESTGIEWKDVFVNDTLLQLFMNPQNTAHAALGVAAYNYYVYDGASEFYPLAYWDGAKAAKITSGSYTGTYAYLAKDSNTVLGELRNYSNSKAGWYYLSHRSDNTVLLDKKIGTAKALSALYGTEVRDEVALNSDYKVGADALNSGKSAYTTTTGETTRFYIDANGNLRCFYSSAASASSTKCSYVYEMDDSQYVKTEALQRILAYFSAELSEKTPSSQISGVQFSNTNSGRDLDDLVLLDWSSNPDEIAAMLSQKFEPGDATGENTREDTGVTEHNFALTGGTKTFSGLQSCLENVVLNNNVNVTYKDEGNKSESNYKITEVTLKDKSGNTLDPKKLAQTYRRDDENAPKFVIVFTDGADDNYFNTSKGIGYYNPAEPVAQVLKDLGYTVIGMYIPAALDPRNENGSLSTEGDTVYSRARQFLSTIVSTDEDSGLPYVYASTDLTAVANVFDRKIMESINGIMSGYTVQEYIDPRFDLQTDDGTVWHLNGNGSVTIESAQILDSDGNFATVTIELEGGREFTYEADGKSHKFNVNLTKERGALFHLVGKNTDGAARDAYLRYDNDKDMYFLIWVDQTIRSSPIGSTTMMPVWSVEYWLVAKDDFLGGDAVLTSGNGENLNYLYHPADVNEDAYAKYVFDSWLALSESLREEYDSHWMGIWNNRTGTDAATYTTYMNQWKALTATEQQAMVDQWMAKYPNDKGKVSTTTFTEGNRSDANGARIMYMIAQMNLKRTNQYDANSGTSDMKKLPNKDENPDKVQSAGAGLVDAVDDFPSKGFPRIAVNVSPASVYKTDLVSTVYLGEVMSPVLVLNNMVNNNPTNWYLNYLARYAAYLYGSSETPLLDLLKKWDSNYDGEDRNSFSVPYMYLPNYQYDAYGRLIATKLNNAGEKAHWEDVLGILTFHWELVKGAAGVGTEVVNETTMSAWEAMEFELTVEFTVFREGDTYDGIVNELEELAQQDEESYLDIFDDGNIHLIGRNEDEKLEDLPYDRTQSLNNLVTEKGHYAPTVWLEGTKDGESLEGETDGSEGSGGALGDVSGDGPGIFDDVPPRKDEIDKNKATIEALMQLMDVSEEEAEEIVNPKDKFYNNGRTQQVVFDYQPKVVGAELALELKIHEGLLRNLPTTISVTLKRDFTDNDFAEDWKEQNKDSLKDYGKTFTVTFTVENPDGSPDDEGFYTVFAKATKEKDGETVPLTTIAGEFGGKEITPTALPIGNYTIQEAKANKITFVSSGFETDASVYKADYFYVNRDLFDTKKNPDGYQGNIAQVAGGVDFGTTAGIRDYASRIGMVVLKTPSHLTAKIVIEENGGKETESFLYKITNTDTQEELIVSVHGGGSTTIIVPFGTYTVEEISDWSWRYETGVASGSEEYWEISEATARTVVDTSETRIVTYSHESNNKGWLGGEKYTDFFFGDSRE